MGDFMIMKDHINLPGLVGLHPSIGDRDLFWGPRFTNMFNCYDAELRKFAKEIARQGFLGSHLYILIQGATFYKFFKNQKKAKSTRIVFKKESTNA
jgi:purine nucleoside phosphorylase